MFQLESQNNPKHVLTTAITKKIPEATIGGITTSISDH